MSTPEPSFPSAFADLDSLRERARALMINAQRPLTRSGYRRDFEQYQRFCSEFGLIAVPASESTICLYLAYCSQHLRVATIARRLASIADGLKSAGEDTTPLRSSLVQQTWKGIRHPGC